MSATFITLQVWSTSSHSTKLSLRWLWGLSSGASWRWASNCWRKSYHFLRLSASTRTRYCSPQSYLHPIVTYRITCYRVECLGELIQLKDLYRESPHFVISQFGIPAISWFSFSENKLKKWTLENFWRYGFCCYCFIISTVHIVRFLKTKNCPIFLICTVFLAIVLATTLLLN